MKRCIVLMLFALLLAVAGCQDEKKDGCDCSGGDCPCTPHIEQMLQENAAAREEYEMHVSECGEDVVGDYDGTKTSKGCDYRIKLDELFFQSETLKTGLLQNPKAVWEGDAVFAEPSSKDLSNLPTRWSLLDMGVAKDVPINSQTCGDCWSQASTKGLELILAAQIGKIVPLSVQTQISRCSNHGSCGGGYMTAPSFLVEHGNPFEAQDPYQGRNTSCKFSDSELQSGFEYRPLSAPYVGRSLNSSRWFPVDKRAVNEPDDIKAMMIKYKSPAVVTILAISQSGGTITSCSGINSGGNHMQDIVGWGETGDANVAEVWNSWGRNHGNNGITRMKWSCGPGKLNRGLGLAARVYEYKGCDNPADPYTGGNKEFLKLSPEHGVWIGRVPENGQTCNIMPKTGLSDFDASGCRAFASPDTATEYHIEAYSKECDDRKSAMALITPLRPSMTDDEIEKMRSIVLTPFGTVDLRSGERHPTLEQTSVSSR